MWKAWFCLFRGKGGIYFFILYQIPFCPLGLCIFHFFFLEFFLWLAPLGFISNASSEDLAWYTIITMLPEEYFACPEAFRTIEYKGRKILVLHHIIFNKAGEYKHVKLCLVIHSTI